MADIGANRRRARQTHLRVHVGAVHVHLTAVLMDDVADGADLVLEYAMGGRVRNHQARQVVAMFGGLPSEIVDIDIAVRRGGDDDHAHAGHGGAGGIGAVGGCRDQHDVAVMVAAVRGDTHG